MKLTKTQLKRSCDICKQRPAPYWIGFMRACENCKKKDQEKKK